MKSNFVEFISKDGKSLERTKAWIELVAAAKRETQGDEMDATRLDAFLMPSERAYFWHPSDEEMNQWRKHWDSMTIDQRHAPDTPMPPWHFGSLLDIVLNAEYEISGVTSEDQRQYLTFEITSHPYGGTASLVALLECMGNTVVGIHNGVEYSAYVRPVYWSPAD